ncbi:hypothetical protein HJ014_16800 [Vibrio parahaemolyticus]|nr:hypothetical protein [Vibrio parahaemolyticus]
MSEQLGFIRTKSRNIARTQKKDMFESVVREFDDMIGLENVKEEINKLIAFSQVISLRRERNIPTDSISLHMIFSGPPGTGKTEVARKVGRLLKSIGLLKKK